jgi:hypothetical protein
MTDEDIKDKLNEWFEGVKGFFADMMTIFAKIKETALWLKGIDEKSADAAKWFTGRTEGKTGQEKSFSDWWWDNTLGSLGGGNAAGSGGGSGSYLGARAARGHLGVGDESGVGGGGRGAVAKGALTPEQGAALLRSEGATPEEAAFIGAHMGGESRGNPFAHNPNAATGDNSYGLWQVNMIGRLGTERRKAWGLKSNEDLYDPHVNARAALSLYRAWVRKTGGRGTNPWTGSNRFMTPEYSGRVRRAADTWKPGDADLPKSSPFGTLDNNAFPARGIRDTPDAATKKTLDRTTKAPAPAEEDQFSAARGIREKKKGTSPQASDMSHFQGATRQMAINLYAQPGSNTIISAAQVGGNAHA